MVCVAGPAASLDAKLSTVGAKLHVLAGPAIRIAGTIPGVSASIAGSAVTVGTVRGALAAPRSAISATTGTVASIHAAVPLGLRSSMLLWVQPQINLNAALPAIRARLNLRALEQAAEVISFNQVSGLNGDQSFARGFVRLKPWAQRPLPSQSSLAIAHKATKELGRIRDAKVFVMNPPAVRGLGANAGFNFMLKDINGLGHQALLAAKDRFLQEAHKLGELAVRVEHHENQQAV